MLIFANNGDKVTSKKLSEKERISKIRAGNKAEFEALFFEYDYPLKKFAHSILGSKDVASDVVQDVFLRLWRIREKLMITNSLKLYLYQAVRNQSINYLKKHAKRQQTAELVMREQEEVDYYYGNFLIGNEFGENSLSDEDESRLIRRIWELVDEMPERRRLVFELHRQHGLSYAEIAKVLDIKIKTVENHMGLAFQYLREGIDIKNFENH